jgi:hypothetical protein
VSAPDVLGSRAEAARLLVNQALGFHRTQMAGLATRAHRSRLAAPILDTAQVQRQATVLRMISITEAFCVDRLLDLAEKEVAPTDSSVRNLIWQRSSVAAVSTWPSIQATYKTWYSIRPSWTRINQLLEVRNAIAHGLGRLTRVQKSHAKATIGRITQAGVTVVGDLVVLEEPDLQYVRQVCVDLVSEVDQLVQSSTGDVS